MNLYVQPTLAGCFFTTYTFDLWMLKGAHEIFAMVVNFIHNDWDVKHVTILFEVIDISASEWLLNCKSY
jgi:hypothetical protein